LKDEFYIRRCFELALNGQGLVSPNPLVGAVIVKKGKVIGEGWHGKYGGPHAEVEAVNRASEDVAGATLYCNLEPCCHTNKQTPPCAQMLVRKKIARVVVSNLDPNPEVAGKGLNLLKSAGIEVTDSVLNKEGAWLNRFYFKTALSGKPWITVKIAQSLDAKIALDKGKQIWITGPESKKYVHQLRAWYDAVLVGSNTVCIDNPSLTVREVSGRNPRRIILTGSHNLPQKATVLNDNSAETWIFSPKSATLAATEGQTKDNVRNFYIGENQETMIDLDQVIKTLAKNRVNSVLVEGGQNIFSQFLEQDQFDDVIIFQNSEIFGQGLSSVNMDKKITLLLHSVETIGTDIKLEYRNQSSVKLLNNIN